MQTASAELYPWKDSDGKSIPGAPLSETAHADRALAGRGRLVLIVREPHSEADETWREPTVLALRSAQSHQPVADTRAP